MFSKIVQRCALPLLRQRKLQKTATITDASRCLSMSHPKLSEPKPSKEVALAAIQAHVKKGMGSESTVKLYDDIAGNYERYLDTLEYSAPTQLARIVTRLAGDNQDIKIIDVGAGSGLGGVALAGAGFKNIDCLDASQGLLNKAKEKGVYTNFFCHFLGDQRLPIPDKSYDMVTICAAMGENHIPKSGFKDIIRIVKPGGYVVNVFREEAQRVPWYEEGLVPFMKQLEKDGVWKELVREIFPNFLPGLDGITLVHEVL
ncbi:demethylmenaquinone methyltransferase [Aplysia californica]|uniref:Demethylmenaquinone methyltransferase n=1 Tax=Aplysia californica TaxID=6500 RepID=A0ABM1ABD4_APLCA|nr:demethylmenaquinone methyltransferase [Aplysia californica]